MKDYQINVGDLSKMNLFELSIQIIKSKHKKDKYTPVGLKCCKKDDENLKRLYMSYAHDLLFDLVVSHGVSEGIIVE